MGFVARILTELYTRTVDPLDCLIDCVRPKKGTETCHPCCGCLSRPEQPAVSYAKHKINRPIDHQPS